MGVIKIHFIHTWNFQWINRRERARLKVRAGDGVGREKEVQKEGQRESWAPALILLLPNYSLDGMWQATSNPYHNGLCIFKLWTEINFSGYAIIPCFNTVINHVVHGRSRSKVPKPERTMKELWSTARTIKASTIHSRGWATAPL